MLAFRVGGAAKQSAGNYHLNIALNGAFYFVQFHPAVYVYLILDTIAQQLYLVISIVS
jgi:hypothetical protein